MKKNDIITGALIMIMVLILVNKFFGGAGLPRDVEKNKVETIVIDAAYSKSGKVVKSGFYDICNNGDEPVRVVDNSELKKSYSPGYCTVNVEANEKNPVYVTGEGEFILTPASFKTYADKVFMLPNGQYEAGSEFAPGTYQVTFTPTQEKEIATISYETNDKPAPGEGQPSNFVVLDKDENSVEVVLDKGKELRIETYYQEVKNDVTYEEYINTPLLFELK